VAASSTVDGGGGCEGYFQIPIAYFFGTQMFRPAP